MKLALIACAAALVAAACATPSVNATQVAERAERDRATDQARIDAYHRADDPVAFRAGAQSSNR